MLDIFKELGAVCGSISAFIMLVSLLVRPVRERIFGIRQITDGVKCLLRADMLRAYYKHRETCLIRQHEYENFVMEFGAYKALGGNGFINHICEEVQRWEVVT